MDDQIAIIISTRKWGTKVVVVALMLGLEMTLYREWQSVLEGQALSRAVDI